MAQLVFRGLQWLGLLLPPVSIVLELTHAISLGQMLIMLVMAASIFWIGRLCEGFWAR